MKTEISRDSHQSEKRYSGVYQQQGRMLTDADWNELVDILKARLNEALGDVIGSKQGSIGGTPRHRALRIVDDGGVKIQPGFVYVDGMAAQIRGDLKLGLDEQPDFPAPPDTPPGVYVLYADLWERTVTHLMDERLLDQGLHGADTCSRKQTLAQIKWCPCPDGFEPEQSATNPAMGDAGLTLTLLQKTADSDACDPCAAELNIESRVGNYLFRVEVHDVQGDANNPDEITLKWSSENGAEQFPALPTRDEMPAGFVSDQWVYEFFDQTSERHLGVHLNSTAWQPARAGLKRFSAASGNYTVPAIPGSSETQKFIRRWDGYCKLNPSTGELLEGWDRGGELSKGNAANSLGFVSIGSSLRIVLSALNLELELSGKSFVAGDFWLADVREAEHGDGSDLPDKALPQGITHYYLTLATVSDGSLQPNPERDRKYAFPSLSELTRMFIAGGDGQQAMPGHQLAYPLQVDVANGEWPINGAILRYGVEAGGGTLLKPSFVSAENFKSVSPSEAIVHSVDGMCASLWQLGTSGEQRVKVTLIDANGGELDHPPLFFFAQINAAEEVAYIPQCADAAVSVHSLLSADDAAVDWPALDSHGHSTVKHALDTLICKLDADKLPYDATTSPECWQELSLNSGASPPQTVQQAIDLLGCSIQEGCCRILISPGDDIKQKLSVIADGQDAEVCFKHGQHIVKDRIDLVKKGRIVFHGCGAASRILAPNSESAFRIRGCVSIYVHDIAMLSSQSSDKGKFDHLGGTLDIVDVDSVSIERVDLTCPAADAERSACCLRVAYDKPENPRASVRVQRSLLNPGHHQIGLLMVNVGRAQIEDNEIRVRAKSKHWVLKERLKSKKFRQAFRNILISNLSFSETSSISDIQRNGDVSFEKQTIYFSTDSNLVEAWKNLIEKKPPAPGTSGQALIGHLRSLADQVLLDQGKVGIKAFENWYRSMASNLPAIAAQGIVSSGRSAQDVRVLNNTVIGVAQGVHVGLSHTTTKKYVADVARRVQIKGNHITNYLSAEYRGERHGIYVGNCSSLDVESNYINVEFFPFEKQRPIEGIRLYGFMGKLVLVRHNHVNGYTTGIFVRILNDTIDEQKVWQVVSNMLEATQKQVYINRASHFLVEHNA